MRINFNNNYKIEQILNIIIKITCLFQFISYIDPISIKNYEIP